MPIPLSTLLTALLIFTARLLDVSFGTLRIINLSRGRKGVATALGFCESLLWLVAIHQIFAHLDQPIASVAYAAGFATGTYVGMVLEEKLALGLLAIRVITREDASELVRQLNEQDFGVTSVAARGAGGRVRLVFSIVRRRQVQAALATIERLHPRAFVSTSDVRTVSEGVFPLTRMRFGPGRALAALRKSK